MSLLMEALRKAEEAKRLANATAPPAPPVPAPPKKKPLSQLSGQAIEAEFLAQGATLPDDDELDSFADPSGAATRRTQTGRGQRAAASVFAAKQTPTRHNPVVVTAALLLCLLPIGGILLWYVLQQSQPLVTLNPPMTASVLPAPPPVTVTIDPGGNTRETAVPTPAPALTTADSATDVAAPPTPASEPALPTQDGSPPQSSLPAPDTIPPPTPAIAQSALPEFTPAPLAPAQEDPPAVTLRISRSAQTPQLHPQLVAAYASLRTGDYAAALPLYQQVLRDEPDNRDALLGLASAYARNGDSAAARRLYSHLLQLDPRDPMARTGVLQGLDGSGVEQESELKALVAQFPELASAAFALGNLYAAQGRWSEAQPAYFKALLLARRESQNPSPDYAFNLAVSLERLGQGQAALDYYRQAAQLATTTQPAFDPSVLRARLRQLGDGAAP